MAHQRLSRDGPPEISPLSSFLTDSSSIGSCNLSESLQNPMTGQPSGSQVPIHSGNLSKFPLATLPHSAGPKSSSSLKFNVFSTLLGRRKRKIPNTNDVKQAMDKFDKLSKKTLKQQQVLLDLFQVWGGSLPDSSSRELVINLFNLLLGPLNMSKDLSAKLGAVGSQFDELCRLEDHRAHLELELVNTQKLYHRASYKGYPNYQLQSYQISYDTLRNDFDETTLRYRNKLVMVLKQSLHMIFASMHDLANSEIECSNLGFRLLAAFDSEPKHVVQSSIYQPLQYYTPLLAPSNDSGSPSPHTPSDEKVCDNCHPTLSEITDTEAGPKTSEYKPSILEEERASPSPRISLSPGAARFAKLSPRLSTEFSLNNSSACSFEGDENTLANRGKRSNLLTNAILNNQKGRTHGEDIITHHGNSDLTKSTNRNSYALDRHRPLSNTSVISPNPFSFS